MAALRSPTLVPAADARRLLLAGQGLLRDPGRRATALSVLRAIQELGYVQIDTISVVERAHHHILMTRLDGYQPSMLTKLLERERKLFEHWTHDASIIPTSEFRYWRLRFSRERERHARRWRRLADGQPERLRELVLGRLRSEGPLRAADFEGAPGRPGGWWNWKPAKAALEYLWRTGEVAVTGRSGFQKVYDLIERVFPHELETPLPDEEEHIEWACTEALERLGAATVREIQSFYASVPSAAVRLWCDRAAAEGRIVEVGLERADGGPARPGYAVPDWRRRVRRAGSPPARTRILNPFDPAVRDRERTARLFGFDYRFEAFVPAPKRQFGYYVMPVLEGDRLTGRVDARLLRKQGELEVLGLWWEGGVEPTGARRAALEDALGLYATQAGARTVTWSGA